MSNVAKNVYMHYVNALPATLRADDHYFLRTQGSLALHYIGANDGSAIAIGSGGAGDMVMAIYDTNEDGIVDNASNADNAIYADNAGNLNGTPADQYALKTDIPPVAVGVADESFAIAMSIAL